MFQKNVLVGLLAVCAMLSGCINFNGPGHHVKIIETTSSKKPVVKNETEKINKLHSKLWMQTSAEYNALCHQVYQNAGRYVQARTAGQTFPKPPAVVMDLDETVIANSGYQSDRQRLFPKEDDYTVPTWDTWEREGWNRVLPVPGAIEFIKAAEAQGVTVIYLSNRMDKNREFTAKAVKHLGLIKDEKELLEGAGANRLLLKTTTSNKDERRAIAAKHFTVLALFGDNLGDFSEDFSYKTHKSPVARRAIVQVHKKNFGAGWFVLPNPAYGSWERILNKDDPLSDLVK